MTCECEGCQEFDRIIRLTKIVRDGEKSLGLLNDGQRIDLMLDNDDTLQGSEEARNLLPEVNHFLELIRRSGGGHY